MQASVDDGPAKNRNQIDGVVDVGPFNHATSAGGATAMRSANQTCATPGLACRAASEKKAWLSSEPIRLCEGLHVRIREAGKPRQHLMIS